MTTNGRGLVLCQLIATNSLKSNTIVTILHLALNRDQIDFQSNPSLNRLFIIKHTSKSMSQTSHCLWEFCVCICLVMHYFVSILVFAIILKRKRNLVALLFFVLQMYCYQKLSVALHRGALGWYALCEYGIS